jgi:hypothetical protein
MHKLNKTLSILLAASLMSSPLSALAAEKSQTRSQQIGSLGVDMAVAGFLGVMVSSFMMVSPMSHEGLITEQENALNLVTYSEEFSSIEQKIAKAQSVIGLSEKQRQTLVSNLENQRAALVKELQSIGVTNFNAASAEEQTAIQNKILSSIRKTERAAKIGTGVGIGSAVLLVAGIVIAVESDRIADSFNTSSITDIKAQNAKLASLGEDPNKVISQIVIALGQQQQMLNSVN